MNATASPTAPTERTTMNGKPVFFRPAKTIINMTSGFQEKLLCDGPTFSTGDACAFHCSFCYVPAMMQKAAYMPRDHKHADMVVRRENAVKVLREQLKSIKPAVRDQVLTIYSSPLVDVAANMDLVRETVAACITLLKETKWHIRLLSKSTLLPKIAQALMRYAEDGFYLGTDPFTQDDVKARLIFGVSTGTLDDEQAAAFEQGCPKPSKRIESLHWLQNEGFRTFGMLCPSLPQRNYTQFAQELLHAIRPEKCEHIWAEVMNPRGNSLSNTVSALHHAGYEWQASALQRVSEDTAAWEEYARATFHALRFNLAPHTHLAGGMPRLRFLQYVTPRTRDYWAEYTTQGAVLLGAAAH
ncbi:MAG: radical SAM protein [Prosthecobacter sp.]|uniref:hypothetical protein n=1 Tax=Prosthecobacter sp. TaxID=1965333 RepID=UPI003BB18E4D